VNLLDHRSECGESSGGFVRCGAQDERPGDADEATPPRHVAQPSPSYRPGRAGPPTTAGHAEAGDERDRGDVRDAEAHRTDGASPQRQQGE